MQKYPYFVKYHKPLDRFSSWFGEAKENCGTDYNAMSLSTVDAEGSPTIRTVLLKHFSSQGFVFFTNLGSKKAQDITINNRVALCFYWSPLNKQVVVQGKVDRYSEELSANYFNSRPLLSQVGAWASKQSKVMSDASELEERIELFKEKHKKSPLGKPPFWSGYIIRPLVMEFLIMGDARLHNRERYSWQDDNNSDNAWKVDRLYP